TASAGLSVSLDTTAAAPTAPVLAGISDSGASNTDNITNAASRVFTLAGIEVAATATLLRGTTSVATRSGSGLVTDSTPSADGALSYPVTLPALPATDLAASPALAVTLDTTAAPPAAPDLQPGSDSGSSSSDNITNA